MHSHPFYAAHPIGIRRAKQNVLACRRPHSSRARSLAEGKPLPNMRIYSWLANRMQSHNAFVPLGANEKCYFHAKAAKTHGRNRRTSFVLMPRSACATRCDRVATGPSISQMSFSNSCKNACFLGHSIMIHSASFPTSPPHFSRPSTLELLCNLFGFHDSQHVYI